MESVEKMDLEEIKLRLRLKELERARGDASQETPTETKPKPTERKKHKLSAVPDIDWNKVKKCPKCGESKRNTDFGPRTVRGVPGVQSYCKPCRTLMSSHYYHAPRKNKSKYNR